jgi:hypothetical protein
MHETSQENLEILYSPEQRVTFFAQMLEKDGLRGTEEDPFTGYGILPLTGLGTNISQTNEQVKSYIQERQRILQEAMNRAGIALYDPASAPYSPDAGLSAGPEKVYQTDSLRVAMAKHVTFLDLLPTTGGGIELDKANVMGKFTYIFHDPRIRTSRMQPHRALHLAAEHMAAMRDELAELFAFVQQFEPCIGLQDGAPAMIGRHSETGEYANLEREVARLWPHLLFSYDGQAPIVQMDVINPGIFAEHRGVDVVQYRLQNGNCDHTLTITKLGDNPVDALLVDTNSGKMETALSTRGNNGERLDDAAICENARNWLARNAPVLSRSFMEHSVTPRDESDAWPGDDHLHIAPPVGQADEEPICETRIHPASGRIVDHGRLVANDGGGTGYRFTPTRPQCSA